MLYLSFLSHNMALVVRKHDCSMIAFTPGVSKYDVKVLAQLNDIGCYLSLILINLQVTAASLHTSL